MRSLGRPGRLKLGCALAAGLMVLGGASGAVGQARAKLPSKIEVMPAPANGVDPIAEFAKGVVALNAKQYAVAREALEKATALAPEHYDSWGFLGAARAGLGDWAGSKAAYERMLAIEPMSAHGHAGRGLAAAALKHTAEAEAELAWLDERLKMCVGKCTDRVLLQTMVPQIRGVIAGTVQPSPMASLDPPRLPTARRWWG